MKKTCNEIKHKRWLHDAKFMHNYMDFHLAEWLKSAEGDQEIIPKIVYLIGCPKEFYNKVLEKLIAQTVTNVDEAWNAFVNTLKRAIQKAALATDPSTDVRVTRAQKFVYQLRIKFSQCGLSNSAILDSAFQIDCSGEYDDLKSRSSKGDVSFKEIWSCELIKVLDKQRRPINLDLESSLENNERECCTLRVVDYTKFSRKFIEYMKSSPFSKFGELARPRCDACCPICKALCIEATNHDTRITPHNAIHQPAGIVGVAYREDPDGRSNYPDQLPDSLIPMTCSQRYALNRSFYLNSDELYYFRDFARVFPGWKEPLIKKKFASPRTYFRHVQQRNSPSIPQVAVLRNSSELFSRFLGRRRATSYGHADGVNRNG